jgi:hypothetical protein
MEICGYSFGARYGLAILGLALFFSSLFSCREGKAPSATAPGTDTSRVTSPPPYKPGFGEFMGSIQVHHEKLWFAGINRNWALAAFEMQEIGEAIDDLKVYCTDRPELKSLVMIQPPLDSLSRDIASGDSAAFRKHFLYLTQTCNNCHQETAHGFNVIRIPDRPPFSNQEFRLPKQP